MPKLPKWRPLQRATTAGRENAEAVATAMQTYGLDEAAARAKLDAYAAESEYWINDLYQVQVRRYADLTHINIRRRDGGPILRDWRHFQQIKNELVGTEAEAVELYPAESRKWDEANKYHLWCLTDGSRFPFDFDDRHVSFDSGKARGLRQRGRTMEFPDDDKSTAQELGPQRRACRMCGATEGELHHDQSARDRMTTLDPRLVCMLCAEGLAELD
jgi:hypothetical protein